MSAAKKKPRPRVADVIAERIRRARAAGGLTREGLAFRSGVSVRHLSALEGGEIDSPGLMVLLRVAEGLECDSAELLSGLLPDKPGQAP